MRKVIVCMKQVLDPEAPSSTFKVDSEARRVMPPKGVPPVLNPFDENALEAALRIKDTQDTEITVISMGRNLAKPVLRKSLAAGADKLIILEDEAFGDLDSYSTAQVLALAIKKLGEYDIILCGREAADTDAGQVGSGIAEILGIPSVTLIRKIEANDSKARIERALSDGYEVIEAPTPVLVTASSEVGELRSANLKSIMEAQKKAITVWNAQELGIDISQMKRVNLLKLYIPAHREGKCETVEGQSLEEAGANLAMKLREAGIV
jgi:electron transfer flavoprotein beta subunit